MKKTELRNSAMILAVLAGVWSSPCLASEVQTLYDPTSGVAVADTTVPSGWNTSVFCDWNNLSMDYPGQATVQFTSPDQEVSVVLYSPTDYLETYDTSGLMQHQDYYDYQGYTTHLRYMNAFDYIGFFYENSLGVSAELLGELPVDEEAAREVEEAAQQRAENFTAALQTLYQGYGSYVTLEGYEGTLQSRKDRLMSADGSEYIAEGTAIVLGTQYTIHTNQSGLVQIPWKCPMVCIYFGTSEESLERYRAEYELICRNIVFSEEFFVLNQRYGQQIKNAIAAGRTQAMMSQNQASGLLNDYRTGGESDYNYNYDEGQYTSDDWANDWSNYIYDQNTYLTEDGYSLDVSTQYDSVYQNGDEYYFGSQGNSPYGWTELEPQ